MSPRVGSRARELGRGGGAASARIPARGQWGGSGAPWGPPGRSRRRAARRAGAAGAEAGCPTSARGCGGRPAALSARGKWRRGLGDPASRGRSALGDRVLGRSAGRALDFPARPGPRRRRRTQAPCRRRPHAASGGPRDPRAWARPRRRWRLHGGRRSAHGFGAAAARGGDLSVTRRPGRPGFPRERPGGAGRRRAPGRGPRPRRRPAGGGSSPAAAPPPPVKPHFEDSNYAQSLNGGDYRLQRLPEFAGGISIVCPRSAREAPRVSAGERAGRARRAGPGRGGLGLGCGEGTAFSSGRVAPGNRAFVLLC